MYQELEYVKWLQKLNESEMSQNGNADQFLFDLIFRQLQLFIPVKIETYVRTIETGKQQCTVILAITAEVTHCNVSIKADAHAS